MQPGAHGSAVARPRLTTARAAWALALLLGLQPVTTDVYLPALPALTRALEAPMSQVQLTLSALMLAFGFGQLVWGPVADRWGRRPVLLCGLTLYAAASVAGALAPRIEWLIVWRVLQGAALAASVVCARAIVRDLYEPREGARVMSLGMSGLGVIAIVGPVLGGLVAGQWGWRATLAVVAAAGALTLAFVAWRLPETLPQRRADATQWRVLWRTWASIARHPVFVAWTLLAAFTYAGLFTMLAGSSFVYIDMLGVSPGLYGAAMACGSVSYLVGTFVCRRWIVSRGLPATVRRGGMFTLAGGVLGVALLAAGIAQPWAVLLPQCLYIFGHGIHQPCAQAGAAGPFPQQAGAASALAGFVLAAVAFAIGLWLGQVLRASLWPYLLGVGLWAVATSTVAWTLIQRHVPR